MKHDSKRALSLLCWLSCWIAVAGFVPSAPLRSTTSSCLMGSRGSNAPSAVRRLSLAGVSVSPEGFWVILSVPQEGFWPIQVTSNLDDSSAATSPEALTILQLISGVDMAGAILPPDVLSKLSVLQSENNDDVIAQSITDFVRKTLPEDTQSYSSAHPWLQSRTKLPQVTLDDVQMKPIALNCKSSGIGSFELILTDDILKDVCYNYDEPASANFMAVALALRYKAPFELTTSVETLDEDELHQRFPLFKSADNLLESSQRVTKNIERGFEYHKLSGALRIAVERGDLVAADRIREKLDAFDSLDDLPTLEDHSDGLNSMQ